MPEKTADERLRDRLDEVQRLVTGIKSLKGLRSVKWQDLSKELRLAADEVEALARAANAWKI